jgi:hypothetical protein
MCGVIFLIWYRKLMLSAVGAGHHTKNEETDASVEGDDDELGYFLSRDVRKEISWTQTFKKTE